MNKTEEYYKSLKQEIETRMLSLENGGDKVQLFTRYATDLLQMKGEVDNVSISYDEETNVNRKKHKVNGFSFSDDYSCVDLFITIYKLGNSVPVVQQRDINDAVGLVSNFFKKAFEEEYVNYITDTSEIVNCAHVLAKDEMFRDNVQKIRIYVLTNADYQGLEVEDREICGINASVKIVDLNALCEMAEELKEPIRVSFDNKEIPCIMGPEDNEVYQVYLAIVPGKVLADLYDTYGVRLMESNVRQFLQATGKTNKGIQETINDKPEMFLAYNNGIAATASNIELDSSKRYIKNITDLQIVNGGQTTASLAYARQMDKEVDLSRINVQVKFSVIKKKAEYDEIVANISRCANTQNKVNEADFSANDERLVRIEECSRKIMVEQSPTRPSASFWFFERAKGQYKNRRLKEGFTRQRESQFDMKYPKDHMFTKYDLAKYQNSYFGEIKGYKGTEEIKPWDIIGPNVVCGGNEKNFAFFMKYNCPNAHSIDNIYFEDLVAKALLFKEADKRYGTKGHGNPIGDIKKTVVHYALAVLYRITEGRVDLYKIWREQEVSLALSNFLWELMKQINDFIIADGTKHETVRFDEWGKKKECWEHVKQHKWSYNLQDIKYDLIDPKNPPQRKSMSKDEEALAEANMDKERVIDVPVEIWERTAEWGAESEILNVNQIVACKEIAQKLKRGKELSESEIERGVIIIDLLAKNNIDLLYQADAFAKEVDEVQTPTVKKIKNSEVNALMTDARLRAMRDWDATHHFLKDYIFENLDAVVRGEKEMSFKMKWSFFYAYQNLKARGFNG